MEQRDFLEREIDLLGRVLGKIITSLLGVKSGSVSTKGIEIVDQTLRGGVDLDIEQLLSVERDDLIDFLVNEKGFNDGNLGQMVDILLLLADDMESGDPQLNSCYENCLIICEYNEKQQQMISFDGYLKLEQIRARLISNQI